MERWTGLLGLLALFAVAWSISTARRRFPWRLVAASVVVQLALAWILLRVPPAVAALDAVARGVTAVISAAGRGRGSSSATWPTWVSPGASSSRCRPGR